MKTGLYIFNKTAGSKKIVALLTPCSGYVNAEYSDGSSEQIGMREVLSSWTYIGTEKSIF